MYIVQHMSPSPVTIGPDMLIPAAKEILRSRNFRHLPVVDGAGHLLGMVTDRDLRSAEPSSVCGEDERKASLARVGKTPVGAIMTRGFHTLGAFSTLDDALHVFDHEKVGALPVLDENNKVIGVFSIPDLIRAYKKIFGLGERGSALVAVEDDGQRKSLSRLIHVLEEHDIRFTRLLRTAGDQDGSDGTMYVRVNTFNIKAVHSALAEAGFKVTVPGIDNVG